MSNQVYSNQDQKYYGQRGISVWNLVGDQNVPQDAATHELIFQASPLYSQTDPGNFAFGLLGANRFTTLNEGMYSIKCVTSFSSDNAGEQNFVLQLRLVAGVGTANLQFIDRIATRTGALNGGNVIASVGNTVFLPAQSTFDVQVQNALAGSLMTIQSNQTQMLFTKIA